MSTAGSTTELTPGELLDGKYRVLRLLGVGGMGAVYVAQRTALGDHVAIKCILASQNTPDNRARFLREARAAARIRHPNIVQVFDFGEPAGRSPYMVMELLEGPTLAEVLKAHGRLSEARAVGILSRVCAAVEAGHRRGVLHRDLKPGNIVLARTDDGEETVKVLDFGLARLAEADPGMALTNPGSMLGTCSYMAPEQIEGGAMTSAVDVFALGVIAYEMLTGQLPYRGPTQLATMLKIAEGVFDPPSTHVPGLSPALVAGIVVALDRDPARRPTTARAFAEACGMPLAGGDAEISGSVPSREVLAALDAQTPSRITLAGVEGPGEATMVAAPPVALPLGGVLASTAPRGWSSGSGDPFVGRHRQLDALRRELAEVTAGAGRVMLLDGDPGSGKTRLSEVFARETAARGVPVLHARFFSYEGDRQRPLETFARLFGLDEQGLPDDKRQAFERLEGALGQVARGGVVLLVIHDLEAAAPTDLEWVLAALASERVGLAVVATVTSEALRGGGALHQWRSTLAHRRAVARIEVRPFDEDEVRAWLQARFGHLTIAPGDLRRLHRLTGGNPFHLSQVVRHLVDVGVVEESPVGARCRPLADVALPESVQAVVTVAIERLRPELRATLETAAVIGEELDFATLLNATQLAETELETLVEEAVRAGLLLEPSGAGQAELRFRDPTFRRVLYSALPARRRRRLHERVVAGLEAAHGKDLRRSARILAYHRHAMGDWAATLHWGLVAAGDALARHQHDLAESDLERAREAAHQLEAGGAAAPDADAAALALLEGRLWTVLGRYDAADAVLKVAVELAGRSDDLSLRLDALSSLSECHLGRGDLELGVATGELAVEAAAELADRGREAAARVLLAKCLGPLGRLEDARDVLGPVIGSEERRFQALRSRALRELAWIDVRRGAFVEAEAAAREALAEARASHDLLAEYEALAMQGVVYGEGGDLERSIPILEQALALARRLSLRRREAIDLFNIGEALYTLEQLPRAEERMREALAIFVEIGDRGGEAGARVNLGRVLGARGDVEAALPLLEAGVRLCTQWSAGEYLALGRMELGRLALARGDVETAMRESMAACRLLSSGATLYRWQAEAVAARAAAAGGDQDAAREHLAQAIACVRDQTAELAATMNARRSAGWLTDLEALAREIG